MSLSLLLTVPCFQFLERIKLGGCPWRTGDWLINYQGGFVRRGLLGEAAWHLSQRLDASLLALISFVQVALHFLVGMLAWRLLRLAGGGSIATVLLLSPAFMGFPFYDPQGGFRKDLVMLVAFAATLLAWRRLSPDVILPLAVGTGMVYGVATLAHEATFFFTPFVVYLVWIAHKVGGLTSRQASGMALAVMLPPASAFVASVLAHGNAAQVQLVRESLLVAGVQPVVLCEGAAIAALADGPPAVSAVAAYALDTGGLFAYPLMALLAATPFLWVRVEPTLRWPAFCFVGSVALAPLFVFALDWGRWIYLFVAHATLLVYALAASGLARFEAPAWCAAVPTRTLRLAAVAYVTCWSMPHYLGGGGIKPGVLWLLYLNVVKPGASSLIQLP
jgi:hypothetical protein